MHLNDIFGRLYFDPRFKGIAAQSSLTVVNPLINTVFYEIKAMTNYTLNGCTFGLNFGPAAGASGLGASGLALT